MAADSAILGHGAADRLHKIIHLHAVAQSDSEVQVT